MRFAQIVLTGVVACGGGGGSSGDDAQPSSETYARYTLAIPNVGNLVLGGLGYNQQLAVVTGERLVVIGDPTSKPYELIAVTPPAQFPVAKTVDFPSTTQSVRISSLVADGAAGFFMAESVLVNSTERPQPGVSHWDANGNVLWSKTYLRTLPDIWDGLGAVSDRNPPPSSPDPSLAGPIDGKLAVIAGNSVLVVDAATGAPLWTWTAGAIQLQLHQGLAEMGGLVVFGARVDTMYELRFDWSGSLVGAAQAQGAFTSGSPLRLYPPLRRRDRSIALAFAIFDAHDFSNHSGILVLDDAGTRLNAWDYTLTGDDGSSAIVGSDAPRLIGEHMVSLQRGYKPDSAGAILPLHFAFPIADDGTPDATRWSMHGGPFAQAPDGSILAFRGTDYVVGEVGATCSHEQVGLTSLAKVAISETLPSFTPVTMQPMTFVTTASDLQITVGEGGPIIATPAPNSGCAAP